MITPEILEEITRRLVETYDPVAIYLFGSCAQAQMREDSDVDLAIVVEDMQEPRHKLLAKGYKALFGVEVGKDLVLYQKDDFQRLKTEQTSFAYQIIKTGKQLYAKAHA